MVISIFDRAGTIVGKVEIYIILTHKRNYTHFEINEILLLTAQVFV